MQNKVVVVGGLGVGVRLGMGVAVVVIESIPRH